MSTIKPTNDFKVKTINPWQLYQSMDAEFLNHSEHVGKYAYILYKLALENSYYPNEITSDKLLFVRYAAAYHDIGKAYLNPELLNQKGVLSKEQRREIQAHVSIGMDIFQDTFQYKNISNSLSLYFECIRVCILHHHENVDGTGYPNQLFGNEISALGKICAIVDYFDALTADRSYRNGIPTEVVLQDMALQSGRKFDPELLGLFLKNYQLFDVVQENCHPALRNFGI